MLSMNELKHFLCVKLLLYANRMQIKNVCSDVSFNFTILKSIINSPSFSVECVTNSLESKQIVIFRYNVIFERDNYL